MKNELIWVDHQDGKLGYYINDEGSAVLCDYIGDTQVLYLPGSFGDACNFIDVSGTIPDESFQSCKNVKLIIVDCRYNSWNFGCFIFSNCSELKAIIDLRMYYWDDDDRVHNSFNSGISRTDEFSFTSDNFAPKSIIEDTMSFDQDDYEDGTVKRFLHEVINNDLIDALLEVLRHSEYRDYTGIDLDAYDNPRVIEHFKRAGVNPNALATLGRCWENAKE